MATSKKHNDPAEEKKSPFSYEDELFLKTKKETDEMESDGSASAFDETERVTEDNFDHLSEK